MTRKYFGTDGIRGTVGEYPITPDFVLRLAHAVGRVLRADRAEPDGADWQGHAHFRLHARKRPGVGLQLGRGGRGAARPCAHARRGLPHTGAARGSRCGDQRQPQRLSGQRHQVLQCTGRQAARRVGAGCRGDAGRAAAMGGFREPRQDAGAWTMPPAATSSSARARSRTT